MMRTIQSFCFISIFTIGMALQSFSAPPTVNEELKVWHKITLTFDGPQSSESAEPNPFLDYRLQVEFSKGDKVYIVPGYFAADGNAAETSADSGNKWRVHFAPDEAGDWDYEVSFRKGENIAVSEDNEPGESAGFMDGQSGTLKISPSDKTGRDFRAHGRLNYVGKRYLRFAGTGEYFLKAGADAPENLLAYADFDGGFKDDGIKDNLVKTWEPHVKDWKPGDPTWQDGKGKGLIGAINYLHSKGMNVFSFLPMNVEGDDRNVFPYTSYEERLRMDVSKLDQWEIVFEHGTKLGMYLHFKTTEAENQSLLDDGELGIERKLYYRELTARYSHHLALNWNVGEENGKWGGHKEEGQTTPQRKEMARYLHSIDPYDHHIVIHNGQPFDDILGPDTYYTGASLQTNKPDFSRVHGQVLRWINESNKAGKQWVVACDEPGDAQHSLITDEEDPTRNNARKNALWGTLMAGGAGIEWYFGYAHPHSDLTCQDWRTRDKMWDQSRYALEFFKNNNIPFWEMTNGDELLSNDDDYCFYKEGEIYIVYLKEGGTAEVNIQGGGEYAIQWYNPREGGELRDGTLKTVKASSSTKIGEPPSGKNQDWVALLRKK